MVTNRGFGVGLMGIAFASFLGIKDAHQDAHASQNTTNQQSAAWLQSMPRYPGSQWYPMGSQIEVDGRPRQMAYAQTTDALLPCLDWYKAQFRAQGFESEGHESRHKGWLVATKVNDPWIRTVVAQHNKGQTTLIMSMSQKFGHAPQAYNVPASCSAISTASSVEAKASTKSATFECSDTIDAIFNFYESAWADASRRLVLEPTSDRKDLHVLYELDGESLMVVARQTSKTLAHTVLSVSQWQ
jgi:hypothetical protein